MINLKNFFLFCSGVNTSILNRTPTDTNKYLGIGATIFFTGVFATIAAGYALSTIFESMWLVGIVSVLWGLMIFNLDRFIVSTMKKKGSFFRDFGTATPRIILAVLISVVIAKPLELKIFKTEIESELVKMEQENYKEQDDLVKERYTASIDSIESSIVALKAEINNKQAERDALTIAAIQEADGTGGSMKRNLGPIYKTKKAAADKVQSELDAIAATNNALIASKVSKIEQLEASQAADMLSLHRVGMDGFAARLEGLERASQRSRAIWIANLFIMILFIAIETAPVLTKLMVSRSPYDYMLDKHEHSYEMNHKVITSRQARDVMTDVRFDEETIPHKTDLAIAAEKELAKEAIKKRLEELTGKTSLSRNFLKKSNLLDG
jgi:hypothetical protein